MTTITLLSFGYAHGAPKGMTLFDCRGVRNPFHVPKLRPLTGKHEAVQEFVGNDPAFEQLRERIIGSVKSFALSVALGCHGGRHRSVAIAEMVAAELKKRGYAVELKHRDVDLSH